MKSFSRRISEKKKNVNFKMIFLFFIFFQGGSTSKCNGSYHCFIPVSFWNRVEKFGRKIDKLQIKKSKRYKGSQQKRWNIRRPTFINFLLFYFHRGAVISVHWFKRCRELRTNDPTENDVLLNEYISSILLITICMQHTYGNYPNLHYK